MLGAVLVNQMNRSNSGLRRRLRDCWGRTRWHAPPDSLRRDRETWDRNSPSPGSSPSVARYCCSGRSRHCRAVCDRDPPHRILLCAAGMRQRQEPASRCPNCSGPRCTSPASALACTELLPFCGQYSSTNSEPCGTRTWSRSVSASGTRFVRLRTVVAAAGPVIAAVSSTGRSCMASVSVSSSSGFSQPHTSRRRDSRRVVGRAYDAIDRIPSERIQVVLERSHDRVGVAKIHHVDRPLRDLTGQ